MLPTGAGARSLSGELVVSSAASLTESFTELGRAFRKANPRVRIRFNFASTSSLVNQIQAGAPASVFASADLASHDLLARSGRLATAPRIFARNSMQIVVKPGNPLKVRTVADLSRLGTIALCGKSTPCGVYAAEVLSRSGVRVRESIITRGLDAKATLASVAFGDADAAIVYLTDVKAMGKSVQGIVIPRSQNVSATYGISLVRGAPNSQASRAFLAFVMSKNGQAILARYGFRAP
jgi:molybdate transport system substrate-binding protein